MWFTVSLLASLLAQHAYAETLNVDVGRTGLNFYPNTLSNVAIGDVINFHFYPSNNSVAESTFSKPCRPKSGDDDKPIYSGFVPVNDGVASTMWSMTIDTTDPIWLYSSQGLRQHCRNGQSMVINPPTDSDQTLASYMQVALKANVTSPDEVFGGVLIADDGGQPQQGSRARPTSDLRASMTQIATTTAATTAVVTQTAVVTKMTGAGVALVGYGSRELVIWLFVLGVFVITL